MSKTRSGSASRTGFALPGALVAMVLLFALTSSMLGIAVARGKAVRETEERARAFYFAEAGIEAALYEIAELVDPDGDGIGNKTVESADWTFTVSARSLGSDRWELTSTGFDGGRDVTLQSVVRHGLTTRFPGGAITIVGDVDKTKIKFKKHTDLVIDGGDSPGIVVTHEDLLSPLAEAFAEAMRKGDIDRFNLTGSVMNTFDAHNKKEDQIELSMDLVSDYPEELRDMRGLYNELVDRVNDKIMPSAQVVTELSGDHITLGSPERPATVYLPDRKTRLRGQTLSGYGTLIVNELVLDHGGSLDWKGDIIVIGNDHKKAKLEVHKKESSLRLDGNLVVLGEAKEDVELKIHGSASAEIDGSVFLGTAHEEKHGKKARLKVEGDGQLELNGLLTMVGRKVEAKLKHQSDVSIRGMVQIATPGGPKKEELKFDFDGRIDVRKENGAISAAAEKWKKMGARLGVPLAESVIQRGEIQTESWHPVHDRPFKNTPPGFAGVRNN